MDEWIGNGRMEYWMDDRMKPVNGCVDEWMIG
jgi:hypothetical protein